MSIPLNIETLLSGTVVESERIEFKRGWNPTDIMRTVAAFANDFGNLGSGYIVVGIEEENGMPKRPIYGFLPADFDKIQKEMLGFCNLIRPAYFPRLSLEAIDGKHVLVLWVVAGSNRPYEAPKDVLAKAKDYAFFIRRFSSTVTANTAERQELLSLTANIPFDDRLNQNASINDISQKLVEQHLQAIGSRLYGLPIPHADLCRQMNLVEGPPENVLPKNVALMLFNPQPEKFFSATTINLTEFPDGLAGDSFIEKTFTGAIQNQLVDALAYIKNQIIKSKTIKLKNQAASDTFFNYPFQAVEEALSNAVYHKNYEIREPIEIRILPEAIEIISYGGPDPSIRKDDLNRGVVRARRYRNRRIGEFLKELKLTEGKGTGIPTIKRALETNGSPTAIYDTDGEERRFFVVEFPVHQAFVSEHQDKHVDEHQDKHQDEHVDKPQIIDSEMVDPISLHSFLPAKTPINVIENTQKIIAFCLAPQTSAAIMQQIGLMKNSKAFKRNIEPALNAGLLKMTLPDKPTSRNQKYQTTTKGKRIL